MTFITVQRSAKRTAARIFIGIHFLQHERGMATSAYIGSYMKDEIKASKFYYFDVGLTNFLQKVGKIEAGSESFGMTFEHFIYQELYAHCRYSGLDYPLYY